MKKFLFLMIFCMGCSKNTPTISDDWIGFWSGHLNNTIYFLEISKTKNESSYEIEGVNKYFGTAIVNETNKTLTLKTKTFAIDQFPLFNTSINKWQVKLDGITFTKN